MIEEDFYATIKLITGEEIFAKISSVEDTDQLLVSSPVMISPIFSKNGTNGYKVEPWLKTSPDELVLVNMDKVITVSESTDLRMITMYNAFLKDLRSDSKGKISRKMGYIANIDDAKRLLEKLYKNS